MSRVEDDRDSARLAERLMREKQKADKAADQKRGEASRFARLVGDGKQARTGDTLRNDAERSGLQERQQSGRADGPARREGELGGQRPLDGRSVLAKAKEGFEQAQAEARGRQAQQTGDSKLQGDLRGARGDAAEAFQGRQQDARLGGKMFEQRARSDRKGDDAAARGKAEAGAEAKQGDRAAPRRGGAQESSRKDGNEGAAAGFRYNPALMAPVPVANPRDMGAAARLRELANEIAQKIVKHARVGTNAEGKAEFQIDLKSSVLKGLSIKVSGHNGRIQATFSGSDREVLDLLREQSDGLKQALSKRGLHLEDFKIEHR